jgi:citrate synthase
MTESTLPKAKKSVALSGTPAGNTALCTVGRSGNDLHYRGYDIHDLATKAGFEEVAHLLVHGALPTAAQLAAYKTRLKRLRGLPAIVTDALELVPANAHPMDVLRTGCSVLGVVLPERDGHPVNETRDIADKLVALHPQRPPHRRRDRRRHHRRALPAPAARRAAQRLARPRHGPVAGSVRRARVQCVHVHLARDRRHRLGHLQLHHRCHRRAARSQARRRQRGGDGNHRPLR